MLDKETVRRIESLIEERNDWESKAYAAAEAGLLAVKQRDTLIDLIKSYHSAQYTNGSKALEIRHKMFQAVGVENEDSSENPERGRGSDT